MTDWQIAIMVLAANGLVWVLMRADKKAAANGGRRVPEKTLLMLVLCGGTPAMWLAMRFFRHKTAKLRFKLSVLGIMMLQLMLITRFLEH